MAVYNEVLLNVQQINSRFVKYSISIIEEWYVRCSIVNIREVALQQTSWTEDSDTLDSRRTKHRVPTYQMLSLFEASLTSYILLLLDVTRLCCFLATSADISYLEIQYMYWSKIQNTKVTF